MPRVAEEEFLRVEILTALSQGLDHTRPRDREARVVPASCMLAVDGPAWESAAWRDALSVRVPMAVAPLLTRLVVLLPIVLLQRILARLCTCPSSKLPARREVAVVLLEAEVLEVPVSEEVVLRCVHKAVGIWVIGVFSEMPLGAMRRSGRGR